MLIIILAKYSDRVAKVMGNNSVPVLATLFLLSYSKLYRTIIKALNWSTIMISTLQNSEAVWSADGTLDYLGAVHSPLFVVAWKLSALTWYCSLATQGICIQLQPLHCCYYTASTRKYSRLGTQNFLSHRG